MPDSGFSRQRFSYALPERLIAQHPLPARSASRLLVLDGAAVEDARFADLASLLRPQDLLVFNDTRVIPARLFGRKASGGAVEIMLERVVGPHLAWAQLRVSKPPQSGGEIVLEQGARLSVLERREGLFLLQSPSDQPWSALMEMSGQIPLPGYISRQPDLSDLARYQTVYASRPGAVAAPTAGLHFDEAMLARLAQHGVHFTQVTLHVGAGTFKPVRCDDIREHQMHAEYLEVSAETVAAIAAARSRGGRVIAVGTTSLRALESAAAGSALQPYAGDTRLFIYPGYDFRVVDALITNFHLPESTLLMLVCAFAGTDPVLAAYRHAVAQEYRFFSYGDAMFVSRQR